MILIIRYRYCKMIQKRIGVDKMIQRINQYLDRKKQQKQQEIIRLRWIKADLERELERIKAERTTTTDQGLSR